jgi:hypothetical protein
MAPPAKRARAASGAGAASPPAPAAAEAAPAAAEAAPAAAPEAPAADALPERVRALHARVAAFSFDAPLAPGEAPPAVSFVARYQRDFGVASLGLAQRHCAEYLRFMGIKAALLLAQHADDAAAAAAAEAAGGAVSAKEAVKPPPSGATPSLAVDAVWHTHLLYSRSYARLCALLLAPEATNGGAAAAPSAAAPSAAAPSAAAPSAAAPLASAPQFIHHDPSGGGAAAAALFRAQYDAAREVYAQAFGAPPPAEVWTAPGARFDAAAQFVCVSAGERQLLHLLRAQELARAAGDDSGGDDMGCG